MNYWLVKSEPSVYGWEQFVKDKTTVWDGVRNYTARNNLRAMKKGDMVFFYHSNEGTEIVGIAMVTKEAFQDPTTDDINWVSVELKALKALPKSVTLAQLKSDNFFENMALLKQSRLSVSPVTEGEYDRILKMSV